MPATAYAHEADPRQKLLDELGDISEVELWHNQVLCAIYVAPERTKGGIIRPASNVEEDVFQGKVGLIVKLGPRAFQSDAKWTWPDDVGLGDWVFYKISDGWAVSINRVRCRILEDIDVKGRVAHPDTTW
jgi:co-chaperonin GroES (HSP10)